MSFTKEHLAGLYNWSLDHKASIFKGLPSRRIFDRHNGNQVFFIIEHLLERVGSISIKQGKEIEMMIINKLPFAASSEITVFNWLQKEMIALQGVK